MTFLSVRVNAKRQNDVRKVRPERRIPWAVEGQKQSKGSREACGSLDAAQPPKKGPDFIVVAFDDAKGRAIAHLCHSKAVCGTCTNIYNRILDI